MTTGGIIVAGGRSERMGGVDKLLQPLRQRPLVSYSLEVFGSHSRLDVLAVVVSEANEAEIREMCASLAPGAIVIRGGPRRRDSVHNGLAALPECEHVVIHDAARPLVSSALIDAVLDGAIESGAASCAVPIMDTVKRADALGFVRSTVSRENLWLAQTPQAFATPVLRRAHAAHDIDATDDAALVELIEEQVRLVMGSPENLKVTTRGDLRLVEALLAAREG